jgi:hypothetical protein
MTRMPRHPALVLGMFLALGAAGCAPSDRNSAPSPSADRSTASSAGTSAVSSAGASPTASSIVCAENPQTDVPPSDRLVDLAISSTSTQDVVTFVFEPSTPGPGGPPGGTLDAARPPFSYAGSGLAIDLLGEHAIQVRFSGMTIASETGEPVYTGPADVKPNLPALREAIQYDASEGVMGWYLGYDGSGCVTLGQDGNKVTVAIAHP